MAKRRSRKTGTKSRNSWGVNYRKIKFTLIGFCIVFLLALVYIFFYPNIKFRSDKYYVVVQANSSPSAVADTLYKRQIIKSKISFKLAANLLKFKPGKGIFYIRKNMNNVGIISSLSQNSPLKVSYYKIPYQRSREEIIRIVAKQINVRPDSLKRCIIEHAEKYDMDGESVYSIFITGNFAMPEGGKQKELVEALMDEYYFFWNEDRLKKCKRSGLTPEQLMVLASIVYSETKNPEEMPMIAGVYLNRINYGMKLESDPTIVFANKDFYTKRVYNKHKKIDSKYNTYKNKGLPPGPICSIPPFVVDAVLNYEKHDYLFFCAKGDGSGCHIFSEDFEQHKQNALNYRKRLDSLKIK